MEITVEVTDAENSQGKEEKKLLDKCSQLIKGNKSIRNLKTQGHKNQVSKEIKEREIEQW